MEGGLKPVLVVHQEGVIGLFALAVIVLSGTTPAAALIARDGLAISVALGAAAGGAAALAAWAARGLPQLSALELWQRRWLGGWTASEALAVAVLSGLCEEALFRAGLQPLIGLWPAAALFAVLHLAPAPRLWVWPALALALGAGFGLLYARAGYPACATAHAVVNGVGLLRLRRPAAA